MSIDDLKTPIAVLVGGGLFTAATFADSRLIAGAALVIVAGAVCLIAPRRAIPLLVAYGLAVSGLRRVVSLFIGAGGAIDPLLVVVPGATVTLAYIAIRNGAASERTRLATMITVLTAIAFLGSFNPLQGPPIVGIAGFAFFGVPLLWFWVGRGLVDDAVMTSTLRWVGVLAIPIVVYGLAQAGGWFPSWDVLWIETAGDSFATLRAGGVVRPFATLTGPGEFARIAALGIVLWIAGGSYRNRPPLHRLLTLAVVAVLTAGLLIVAVRVAVTMLALGLGAIAAAKRGLDPGKALGFGVAAIAVLIGLANIARAAGLATGRLTRQIEGLANPFDSQVSTLNKRFGLFTDAVAGGFAEPVGLGTGITTPAVTRLAETRGRSSDADLGDVAISWGLLGLAVYVAIVAIGVLTAYQLARHRRDWLSFGVLGVLFAAGTQWINGGLYALAPLVWLALGWADRSWQLAQRGPPADGARSEGRIRASV